MSGRRLRRWFGGRLHGDDGVAVIEMAIAMPVVLTFVMALADFGLVQMKISQVASAARDGARKGIISYTTAAGSITGGASCPSTPADFSSVCKAATARFAGTQIESVTVECRTGTTTTAVPCSTAVRSVDSLAVTVTLRHQTVTPVGQLFLGTQRTYSATAQMML